MTETKDDNQRLELIRLLTRIEKGKLTDKDLQKLYSGNTNEVIKIGITGMPGSGKSCLISSLLPYFRKKNKKVGVLALDPISPKTGGSILADRVRMQEYALDEGVFIRSLTNENSNGGINSKVAQASRALSAYKYNIVLIETVGIGQSELSIRDYTDLVLVVLPSDFGDKLQGIKAGILEIADILIVNKNDLPAAVHIFELLKTTWNFEGSLISVSSKEDSGISDLYDMITDTVTKLISEGVINARRLNCIRRELLTAIYAGFEGEVMDNLKNTAEFEKGIEKILNNEALPGDIADTILKKYLA
ncbi:ArgK/MeaB family GTPase [Elusimicrobiota bacterium]